MHPNRQHTLSAPQCQRIHRQVQLVDQVVLEQGVDELAAAVGQNILARLRLQCTHRLDHVVADDRSVAPRWLLERLRYHVLLRWIHEIAERVARRHRLERLGVRHVGAPTQQESIYIFHQLAEMPANVIVPVRQRPAAVLKPAISILILAARRLHHAVHCHELVNDQLSHNSFR